MNGDDLHWLAGVVDKGCAITASRAGYSKRAQAITRTLRVCISSTSLSLVTRVHSLIKAGYIATTSSYQTRRYHRARRGSQIRDRYTLYLHGDEAATFLETVQPYLRTAERKVEAALALQYAIRNRRKCKDGTANQQDVNKIERLVGNLKAYGTRTNCSR